MDNIRNFVITAHIDHGKSTLADRLLEITGTVEKRLMKPQYLDQLELERERGITIKMAPVRMIYHPTIENSGPMSKVSGQGFILNLIDTPGHSDFGYEVSRALAAVEGAVLLIDATQGIQAQTLANFENAKKAGLTILGAVNKVDVAGPEQIELAVDGLSNLLNVDPKEILKVSGRTGQGVPELLKTIIKKIPPPINKLTNNQLTSKALIFDSLYDDHKGVIAFVRVFSGAFKPSENLYLITQKKSFKTKELGYFKPKLTESGQILAGETGYIATGIKDPDVLKIGDTVSNSPEEKSIPGYQEPKPVVFVSFYPEDASKYDELKQALAKLRLTDAALKFEPDFSEVLGRGFKGGFLGRLHFEITSDRLEREFKIPTVNSFPSVAYKIRRKEDWETITNPKDFPDDYLEAQEPITKIEIVSKPDYLGAILKLKEIFRFSEIEAKTLNDKIIINTKLPLADLIRDLDDKLRSVTQGFASFSYEIAGYEKAFVAKLEILVAGHLVPGLTRILPKEDIESEARITVGKLKELLPRQQFEQAVQAQAGGRIVARETIPAMRKLLGNFGKTGGDRTRKMKLWKKQQRGKERLKERGESTQIKIPASIFKELLKK